MKQAGILSLFLCFFTAQQGRALTACTVNHLDWDNPYAWAGGQVPINPDTILIKHYITFGHALTIAAPTVLIIESSGTLCGDYLLDVACGARIINYGNVYVNSAKIRDGVNHHLFYAKNQMTITGCNLSGFGNGYLNAADGHTWVWPPVACKTPDTNWETPGGNTTGLNELEVESGPLVFPNPVQGGLLRFSANRALKVTLSDASGRTLLELDNSRQAVIPMNSYAPGLYLLQLSDGRSRVVKKVLNP